MLAASVQAQTAEFDYFKYAGNDARFSTAIDPTHQYYNPVLAGFYPDPSVIYSANLCCLMVIIGSRCIYQNLNK